MLRVTIGKISIDVTPFSETHESESKREVSDERRPESVRLEDILDVRENLEQLAKFNIEDIKCIWPEDRWHNEQVRFTHLFSECKESPYQFYAKLTQYHRLRILKKFFGHRFVFGADSQHLFAIMEFMSYLTNTNGDAANFYTMNRDAQLILINKYNKQL